jgi:serine protein kinase
MSVLERLRAESKTRKLETLSLESYLEAAKSDPSFYATWAERMLKAIGEPELVDTSKDLRLRIIHGNATIKLYKPFSEVYGMEGVIERLVSFFTHSAQGEESRQICELHGPVASAKSTLDEAFLVSAADYYKTVKELNAMMSITLSPLLYVLALSKTDIDRRG